MKKKQIIPAIGLICLLGFTADEYDDVQFKTFNYHQGYVYGACFDAGDTLILSGSEDKTAKVWNIGTNQQVLDLKGHNAGVHAVLYTKDGNRIITGGDRSIRIWDAKTGSLLKTLPGQTTYIWSIDLSPDQKYLVSGSYDKKFKLWDITTGQEIKAFEGHSQSVLSVCFSPDGNYIASGSLDMTIKIWDASTYELIKTLEGHSDNIYDLCFSPDSKFLASASRDKTIRLWDVDSGKIVKTYVGHAKGILTIDFSKDGKHLLSGSIDNTIKLWETYSGTCIYTFMGPTGFINCVKFSNNNKKFLSTSNDNSIIVWDLDFTVYTKYYFEQQILQEISQNPLFYPKQQGESKADFTERQAQSLQEKAKIYEKYYQKYLNQLSQQNEPE